MTPNKKKQNKKIYNYTFFQSEPQGTDFRIYIDDVIAQYIAHAS